jgi:hypothetical protein
MSSLIAEIQAWLHSPFGGNVSAATLFFSVGLLIVIIVFWVYILEKMESVA